MDKLTITSPEVMGGTPVFTGTRVPVQTSMDYIKGGESIDNVLDGFPTVKKEQVIAFLEEADLTGSFMSSAEDNCEAKKFLHC